MRRFCGDYSDKMSHKIQIFRYTELYKKTVEIFNIFKKQLRFSNITEYY